MKLYSFFYDDVNIAPLEDNAKKIFPFIISQVIGQHIMMKGQSSFIENNGVKNLMISTDLSRIASAKEGFLSSSPLSYKINPLRNEHWKSHPLSDKLKDLAMDFNHIEIDISPIALQHVEFLPVIYPNNFNLFVLEQKLQQVDDIVIGLNKGEMNLSDQKGEEALSQSDIFNILKHDLMGHKEFFNKIGINPIIYRGM